MSKIPAIASSLPTIEPGLLLSTLGDEADGAIVIDLRSPAEFADDHLPGAHNLPLFDDMDRALVGMLYKQFSPAAAFNQGRAAAIEGINALVARIAAVCGWELVAEDLQSRVRAMTAGGIEALSAELALSPDTADGPSLPERPVVLHCWRGGLRSRSVVALLRALGHGEAMLLAGGYKAYRKHVLRELETWCAPPAFVLRGLTGVGKTLVLRELERQRPGWTLDLEGHAGHRSSLLGMVGLEPCSQKTFESRLHARLRRGFPGPVVYEGESRKVGDAIIPASIWNSMQTGVNIELVASTEGRVRILMEDYLACEASRGRLREQLAVVADKMPGTFPLVELLDSGREAELTRILLEHYYDPLYRHSEKGKRYALTIESEDPKCAARAVAEWIEER